MAVIRRVNPMSLAKFTTIFAAVFFLVFGIFVLMLASASDPDIKEGSKEVQESYSFTASLTGDYGYFGALIFMPLVGGVIGFILGALGGVLYNGLAFLFNGIEVDIE